MNILHVSTDDVTGGAARAAYRLHTGLLRRGQESVMFVRQRRSKDATVIAFAPPTDLGSRLRRRLRRGRITRNFARYRRTRPRGYDLFSDDRAQYGASVMEQLPPCSVVNLHWIARFIDYGSFFRLVPRETPVVWTLHDMNAFTGGCHYDDGCGRYLDGCGACPQLGSNDANDLSREVWLRKREAFAQVPEDRLHIVTPSRWLAEEVRHSPLLERFSVAVIPNGVDTRHFAPRGQREARIALDIPPEAGIILFAAQTTANRRKGFSLLARALDGLDESLSTFLISLGSGKPDIQADLPHLHLGHVDDDRLVVMAYDVADLLVVPSLQDNLPNTVLESFACGTPVVGFDAGGIPDLVRPGVTGFLAPAGSVDALREAIARMLQDPTKLKQMSENCRRIAVEVYSLEVQALRYERVYESMLGRQLEE